MYFFEHLQVISCRKAVSASALVGMLAAPITCFAQADDVRPGSAAVRGTVVSTMNDGAQDIEIRLIEAKIVIRPSRSGASDIADATTNQYGMFRTPALPPGDYTVCAHAPGFSEQCVPVRLDRELVYLESSINLRPAGPFVWGRVTMLGGAPAARAGAAQYTTRGGARVSLEDGNGGIIAGPVSVSLDGLYVLPGAKVGRDLILRARYDQALAQKPIDLTASDVQGRAPIHLVFSSDHPKISGLQATVNGTAVRELTPGRAITVTAKVEDTSNSSLHYRWMSNSGTEIFPDSASVQWQLSKQAGPNILHVEVTNRKGGFARASINVNSAQLPDLKTNIDSPIVPWPVVVGSLPCESTNSCFQVHLGPFFAVLSCCNFIDPLQTEHLASCGGLESDTACQAALQNEANSYYGTIGVYKPATTTPDTTPTAGPGGRGTFKSWKTQNKFADTPSPQPGLQGGTVRAVYFNSHDLGLGRDMNCRDNSDSSQTWIACYVTNSADTGGAGPLNDAQKSIDLAYQETNPIATVAMEFHSPALVPNQPVTFFIYDSTGTAQTSVALDDEGKKFLPGLCLACHGGAYDATHHAVSGASFLPFDAPLLAFGQARPGRPDLTETAGASIWRLNMMVAKAAASPSIPKMIGEWYSGCGGLVSTVNPPAPSSPCAIPPSYVPSGWKNPPPNLQDFSTNHLASSTLYLDVPAQHCRMCHIARGYPFDVQNFQSFAKRYSMIDSNVFQGIGYAMPFAELTNWLFNASVTPHPPHVELKYFLGYCKNHITDTVNHC
jgi:hypothetical protein